MRTLNTLLSLGITAAMIGGCSAHARVGGKVGRRTAATQPKVEKVEKKVAAETQDVSTQPDARR